MTADLRILTEREATADEAAGIAWWNSLSPTMRAMWLSNAEGCETAADAWERYKARRTLAEQSTSEARVVAEGHERYAALLTIAAGEEVRILTEIARDIEANGDRPRIDFARDGENRICGLQLFGHIGALRSGVTP